MGSTAERLDEREVVLEFECVERGAKVTRTVRPTRLSIERLRFLWEKLKQFDVLFNDFVKDDPQAFFDHFLMVGMDGQIHPTGLLYDVDDIGIFFLNEIRPLDSSQVHFVFWDRIYRGREGLCREMAKHVMDKFSFHRLYAEWPLYAKFSIDFMERIGFVNEGRKRQAILYKGSWFDVMMFSILAEDFEEEPSFGRRFGRRVCVDCGQTYKERDKEMALMKEIVHGS